MEVILLETVVATCRSNHHGSGSVTNVVSVHMQVIYSGGSSRDLVFVSVDPDSNTHVELVIVAAVMVLVTTCMIVTVVVLGVVVVLVSVAIVVIAL